MKKLLGFALSLLGAVVVATPSVRADSKTQTRLISIEGRVLVGAGEGFDTADGAPLAPGRRIMVAPKSSAVLRYSPHCTITGRETCSAPQAMLWRPYLFGAHNGSRVDY